MCSRKFVAKATGSARYRTNDLLLTPVRRRYFDASSRPLSDSICQNPMNKIACAHARLHRQMWQWNSCDMILPFCNYENYDQIQLKVAKGNKNVAWNLRDRKNDKCHCVNAYHCHQICEWQTVRTGSIHFNSLVCVGAVEQCRILKMSLRSQKT